jgi:hypothetical protein
MASYGEQRSVIFYASKRHSITSLSLSLSRAQHKSNESKRKVGWRAAKISVLFVCFGGINRCCLLLSFSIALFLNSDNNNSE